MARRTGRDGIDRYDEEHTSTGDGSSRLLRRGRRVRDGGWSASLSTGRATGRRSTTMARRRLHWVYILRCADNTFYVGHTHDIDARLRWNRAGHGARHTAVRLPVDVV